MVQTENTVGGQGGGSAQYAARYVERGVRLDGALGHVGVGHRRVGEGVDRHSTCDCVSTAPQPVKAAAAHTSATARRSRLAHPVRDLRELRRRRNTLTRAELQGHASEKRLQASRFLHRRIAKVWRE
jgi:hypothetical protein